MDLSRSSRTPSRRAAPGGRRATTAQGSLHGLAGRAAAEFERMRPHLSRQPQRSRAESVLERVKHLV